MPSQVDEGKSSSLPPIIELFSPLPGLTLQDPSREFPVSSLITSEARRQHVPSVHGAIQTTGYSDCAMEDVDFLAGTSQSSKGKELVLSDARRVKNL